MSSPRRPSEDEAEAADRDEQQASDQVADLRHARQPWRRDAQAAIADGLFSFGLLPATRRNWADIRQGSRVLPCTGSYAGASRAKCGPRNDRARVPLLHVGNTPLAHPLSAVSCPRFFWTPICPTGGSYGEVRHEQDHAK